MKMRALLLTLLCLALFPTTSRAQERGQVGLTMGYPTAAGLIWHPTSRIAVRGEITFSQTTSKVDLSLPNQSTEQTTRLLGIGGSLLWYFGSSEGNVRPYLSPRFIYNRATSDDDDDEPMGTTTAGGAFGVQYTPSRRIGLFGEIGLSRTHTERTLTAFGITGETSTTGWGTRSAVGVIFYFGG
jgi:hypothetical protein